MKQTQLIKITASGAHTLDELADNIVRDYAGPVRRLEIKLVEDHALFGGDHAFIGAIEIIFDERRAREDDVVVVDEILHQAREAGASFELMEIECA